MASYYSGVGGAAGEAIYSGAPWGPADVGFKAWTFDPVQNEGNHTLTSGRAEFIRIRLGAAASITGVGFHLQTNGATLTAGQNFAALYDTSGNRLAISADQSTAWTSGAGDNKSSAFTAPYVASAGDYFVAFLAVGSTPPVIGRAQNTQANPNGLLTTPISGLRYCRSTATNLTSLASTFDFAASGQITGSSIFAYLY